MEKQLHAHLYQTCISFIVAKTNSHLGANCVSHGFHGLMPQTCISLEKPGCELCFPLDFMVSEAPNLHSWEKPSRTWVRIVFSHGFMGSEAPNLHLFGKTYTRTWVRIVFSHGFRCNITQTANLHSLWQKPIGNLVGGWGGGVVGGWGGGVVGWRALHF